MAKKLGLKSRILSASIGLLAGGFFGWMMLARLISLINGGEVTLFYNILGAVILGITFMIVGIFLPRFTEIMIAGISIVLLLQASWDWGAKDWNTWRTAMVIGSTTILLLDILIGAITWRDIARIGRRQLGAK